MGALIDRSLLLRRLSTAILVAGFLAAVALYAAATRPSQSPLGDPDDSKVYLRQMEMYGGKANVLASDTRQWLASLWHGKRLAFSVLALAALTAAGFRFAAIPLPPEASATTRPAGAATAPARESDADAASGSRPPKPRS